MSATKIIIVTGAASGIGRAVALTAAAHGGRIGLLDVNGDAVDEVAETISRAGGTAHPVACDVASESGVRRAFLEVQGHLGHPDGLFTAAGVDAGGPSHNLSLATWQRVLTVNLTGTFLCCQAMIAALLQTGVEGSIVCCSSPAARVGYPAGGASAYSASKAGVSALVRSLAVEYAPRGIRVNAVVPGATETPLMWSGTAAADRERLREQVASEVPLGRLADPTEPADAVRWLLSDAARYVTGSELVCDGGVLAKASISF